jgi:hypothetical protein
MKYLIIALGVLSLSVGVFIAQDDDITGPEQYPADVNPLTGLEVDDPTMIDRRPMLVKIVNAPDEARPQWGLFEAEILWEYLLAGGYTRLVGIFLESDAQHVGPIRSLRLPDFELTRLYGTLTVTSGMSDGTWIELYADDIMPDRIIAGGQGGDAMYRDPSVDRSYDLTLFGDLAGLRQAARELGRDVTPEPITGMAFSERVPAGGIEMTAVDIRYAETTVRWMHDPDRNVWMRATNGQAHGDAIADQQFYTDNVVIIEEDHLIQPQVRDQYWGYTNFAYRTNFVGSGRIVLLRDGQAIEGEWRRESRDDDLRFYDLAGNILPFKPGRTLFNLVPRWVGGYQLIFDPVTPVSGTVNTASVNLRWGPGTDFSARTAAYLGDTLPVIGRNNDGSWVQVAVEGNPLWVTRQFLDLSAPISDVLLVRPTNEN